MTSDLAAHEAAEERKWSNWERVQNRMKERQNKRTKPRQTQFAKKKKLKNIENPEWKKIAQNASKATQKMIDENYALEMKAKKIKQKKIAKETKQILDKKWEMEEKMNTSGLEKPPPEIKNWAKNLNNMQYKQQQNIEKKFAQKKKLEKKQALETRAAFEAKYPSENKNHRKKKNSMNSNSSNSSESESSDINSNIKRKKKKKKRLKPVIINKENNAFTAISTCDLLLLERIWQYYPSNIVRKDKLKNTVLHMCMKDDIQRVEIIEYLLLKLPKKFLNAQNNLGNTPLHLAMFKQLEESVLALFSHPKCMPNVEILNLNGRTPLMQSAMRDDADLINLVLQQYPLKNKPNLDIVDKQNKTALTYAVEHNQHNAACVLINAGASYSIKNSIGKTAMDMARFKSLRCILKREKRNIIQGMLECSLVRVFMMPKHIIAIIAEFNTSVPVEVLEEEAKLKAKNKKLKKNQRRNGRRGGRRR